MGYQTFIHGEFKINKPLDDKTFELVRGLHTSRRMKRDIKMLADRLGISVEVARKEYGDDGEFYVAEVGLNRWDDVPDIVEVNTPPEAQPTLWNSWDIEDDKQTIFCPDEQAEYGYLDWLEYINDKVLKPRGYHLAYGEAYWSGDEDNDKGEISIENGEIVIKRALVFFVKEEDLERVNRLVNEYLKEPLKELLDVKIDKAIKEEGGS